MVCAIRQLDAPVDIADHTTRVLYAVEFEDAMGGKGSQVYMDAAQRDEVAQRVAQRKGTTQVLVYEVIALAIMPVRGVEAHVYDNMQLEAEDYHVQANR